MDLSALSGIQNATALIQNAVNQYILRVPTDTSIAGFVFDVMDDEDISQDAEITDHYVEANSAIQDHIAIKPLRFTLRGYIGELSQVYQSSVNQVANTIQKLTSVAAFLPTFQKQASQVYGSLDSVVTGVTNVVNDAANVYGLIGGSSTFASKQQQAYFYFTNIMTSRMLVSVETPFTVISNMAIENIRILQRGTSRYTSEFSITLKQIRKVSTLIISPVLNNPAGSGSLSNLAPQVSGRFADMISNTESNSSSQGAAMVSTPIENSFSAYQKSLVGF